MKTKAKADAEGAILDLGWDTHSLSSNQRRAERGAESTPWRATWVEVLADVQTRVALPVPRQGTAAPGALSGA